MRSLEVRRPAAAPASAVWAVMTDLESSSQFIAGIDQIEMLAGAGSFGIGTRWRETRTIFGRTATEEMEVTGVEDGRSYTVVSDSGGVDYTWTMTTTPLGDRSSEVSLRFAGEPGTLAGRLMAATIGRLFERSTRKALGRDLDDIAAEAERRAATHQT